MNLLSVLLSNEKLAAALPHISVLCVLAAGKLGLVMPLIVAAIAQSHTSKAQKTALSVVSCLAASAIICVANGALSGINWAASLLVMLFISWELYARLYKPSGKLAKFEKATDVASIAALVLSLFGDKASGAFSAAQTQTDAATTPAATAVNAVDVPTDTPDTPDTPQSPALTGDVFK